MKYSAHVTYEEPSRPSRNLSYRAYQSASAAASDGYMKYSAHVTYEEPSRPSRNLFTVPTEVPLQQQVTVKKKHNRFVSSA